LKKNPVKCAVASDDKINKHYSHNLKNI